MCGRLGSQTRMRMGNYFFYIQLYVCSGEQMEKGSDDEDAMVKVRLETKSKGRTTMMMCAVY